MVNREDILEPGRIYHVYNHAHGNETMFNSAENCRFFLSKYKLYVSPIAETLCYCLMSNHFHFVIRCRDEEVLGNYFLSHGGGGRSKTLTGFRNASQTLSGFDTPGRRQELLSKLLSQQFSHLFNSYTQALNKQLGRIGGLFMRPFKRIGVHDMRYLQNLVLYVHRNPVEAGLCLSPTHWSYSSFTSIVERDNSFVNADEVIALFDDIENFEFLHQSVRTTYSIDGPQFG